MTQIDNAIRKVFPRANIQLLNEVFARFGITTKQQQIAFCAQIGHESNNFTVTVENLNYSAAGLAKTWPSRFATNGQPNAKAVSIQRNPRLIANAVYNGRMGNQLNSDDGWNYRGRGLIQLTGKNNYRDMGSFLYNFGMLNSPMYFIDNPDVISQPMWSYIIAAGYWKKNNLNAYVDNFTQLTKKINGGTLGLKQRQELKTKLENLS